MSLYPAGSGTEELSERARWHLGGLLTIRMAGADSNGSIGVVEERALRGYATPAHVHGREDETLFVIEGELEYSVDGRPGIATAGEAVFLPRGLAHNFRVVSAEAHFLVIITPGGFEEFFQEVSPPATAAGLPGPDDHPHTDPALMTTAAADRGTTVFRGAEPVVAAARTVTASDDPVEVARAYRAVEDAVAGPVPAPLDTLVGPLLEAAGLVGANPAHARALILLGILVERGDPADRRVHEAVPDLLGLLRPDAPRAVVLAFTYFLAHFPEHADAVRAAVDPLGLSDADLGRLLRCLAAPDAARIGRVWPTPTVWELDAAEREVDRAWRATLRLDDAETLTLWESETTALLAYLGARAENAVTGSDRA
ncbi:cupin domain-containing protein [Umezawaea endophytica]|uniref:Cupin domain-containing protein n=1 Tax=Umezawaea endophytica TaxID=1654476 RepID=A0A9X2VMM1_9PSEU|nr:cupin domain-containing protein [Umezawaea endophytica]MCS7479395.1 cupin domain-containing protein [Umezawaea endophytica]